MTTNFYIEQRRSKGTGAARTKRVPIDLTVCFEGMRLHLYTGERIDADQWDSKKQRVRRGVPGRPEINALLDDMEERAKRTYREAKIMRTAVDGAYLLANLKSPKKKEQAEDFFVTFDKYIEAKSSTLTQGHCKMLKNARNKLERFSKEKGVKIALDTIDVGTLEGFADWMFKLGNTQNTVSSNIQRTKFFLQYALDRSFTKNEAWRKFSLSRVDSEIYFLTWPEVMAVQNLGLRGAADLVRDTFCLQCYTGLRFSDAANLKKTDVRGDFLVFNTIKTREDNSIPLTDRAKAILDKYRGHPGLQAIPTLSLQKTNNHLKVIAKQAGIIEPVTKTKFRGPAERIETTVPKWQVVTTHIGRKTFITNSLERGASSEVVMSISGHKTHKAFKRYFKVLPAWKRDAMQKAYPSDEK